jgi:hypothetical protein
MSAPAFALADPPAIAFDPDPPAGMIVSEADYWVYYYEHENGYEWNDGCLEIKPVSDVLTVQIYQWLLALLRFYLDTHENAQLTALEMGFRLQLPSKVAIRKPDLGLVLASNPTPLQEYDRVYHGIFDLCVEALSDSTPAERARDTEQKRREYETAGVGEYYILHHEPHWQRFYWRNRFGLYEQIPIQDGVLQSGIVPGFRFRVEDLRRRPRPEVMIEDPVYAPFVLPAWQRDRAAWQQDRQTLEEERRIRAQAERAQAEAERIAQQERVEKEVLLAELARLRGIS